jgi:hypothetical protein
VSKFSFQPSKLIQWAAWYRAIQHLQNDWQLEWTGLDVYFLFQKQHLNKIGGIDATDHLKKDQKACKYSFIGLPLKKLKNWIKMDKL